MSFTLVQGMVQVLASYHLEELPHAMLAAVRDSWGYKSKMISVKPIVFAPS